MLDHIRFIKAGILVLLVWSMQLSFVVADQLPEINAINIADSAEMAVVDVEQHNHKQLNDSEEDSCHPASNMNCEFDQCTSCLFYIAQEYIPTVAITSVSSIKPVSVEFPREIQTIFYRPPATNS